MTGKLAAPLRAATHVQPFTRRNPCPHFSQAHSARDTLGCPSLRRRPARSSGGAPAGRRRGRREVRAWPGDYHGAAPSRRLVPFGRVPGVPATVRLLVYVRVVLLDLLDDGPKGCGRLELRNIQTSVMPLLPIRLGYPDLKHSLSFY